MLEVIAKTVRDVVRINNSDADCIEFCRCLNYEGLTQRLWKIRFIATYSEKPVMAIVRNHHDNFYITKPQLQKVIKQVRKIATTQAKGIVWGAITHDHQIDVSALRAVVHNKGKLELTFHKAFDLVKDKVAAAQILKSYGVKRILTSGGLGSPLENLATLKAIKKIGIEIVIGGGVTTEIAAQLKKHNFTNIHIGRAARKNHKWKKPIKINLVNAMHRLIKHD